MQKQPKFILRTTAAALTLCLGSGVAVAADQQRQERTGLLSGLVLGAVVGGPPGAVIGAIGGGLAGRSAGREDAVAAHQAQIERLRAQLQQTELQRAELQKAKTEAERAAAQRGRMTAAAVVHNPAPSLSLDSSVQFRTASAELEPHYAAQLRSLAALARQFPQVRVHLLGHADLRGGAAANRQLSQERVRAVRAVLLAAGVEKERITCRALGESAPLYERGDHEGRDFERRVLIRMISAEAQS